MGFEFEQINGRTVLDRKSSSSYCKTYMFHDGTGKVTIVDPVLDEINEYLKLLEQRGFKVEYILETHTHADHVSGASALKEFTGGRLVMHENAPATCLGDEDRVKDGDVLHCAGVEVRMLHTPGHTSDSVSYVLADRVLTGDALFLDEGGAGRDDLPGGDAGAHWGSIQKLLSLPGELLVFPAHDYRGKEPSSLDNQRKTNPHVKKAMESREAFIDYINNLKLGPAEWMKDVLAANYACALSPGDVWVPVDAASCEVKGTLDLGANAQQVQGITPGELEVVLKSGEELLLLDVREPFELQVDGKLENVLNIPITMLSSRLDELEPFKTRHVITICKVGGRAYTAGQILKQAGFKNVEFLEGGMLAWNSSHQD